MKLLTIYRSVDNCDKGSPALKAYVVHMKSQKVWLCSNTDLLYSLFNTASFSQ